MKFKDRGELIAAEYMKNKGFILLENNYRGRFFEVDLIVKKRDTIVFIEVKRRSSSGFMDPIKSIDKKKKNHILRGARLYLLKNNLFGRVNVRFDVITVKGNNEEITHIENAFGVDF